MHKANAGYKTQRPKRSTRNRADGLNMATVNPQFIDEQAPRPSGPRPFGLPEAPVFRPTIEEFQNPLQYIESIRPQAEEAGICKIIPPASWQPNFAIDTEHFFFRPRIQKLNFMEGKSRTTLNYLDQLQQFHLQNGVPMTRLPTLDRKPIDLFKLKKEVARRGGHEVVTETKKWAEVARAIGITGKTCTSMSHSIKTAFVKWVAPYEEYLAENGKLEGDAIELSTMSNESKDLKAPENDYHTRSKDEKKKVAEVDYEDTFISDSTPLTSSSKDNTDEGAKHRHGTRQQNGARPIQSYLKPGEFCEICLRSENEENLLLCDVCNNGFHTYCLTPPIIGVPKGEWYCLNCLQKQGDDYGFEDGEERSLAEFQKIANDFKANWFITHRVSSGEVMVDENDVEMEFWRLVESPYEEIEVEYGADLHSSHHGSGFPTIEKQPFDPYSSCGWNLNNIAILPESLLRNVGSDIPGVMIPWLYVGMVFSTFCWHAEDHYQYSINYNHFGETKTWYGIPATHADRFEEVLKKTVPELFEISPDLLFHITTMISPASVCQYRVPCYAVDQRAHEFVVTFPRAYHAGFNHGFNFCEAVNFTVPDWMPYGTLCVDRYREFRKTPVFSHDELVIATALKNPSEQTALWLKPELERLRGREIGLRNDVRAKHPKVKEVVDNVEINNEEQAQCVYCSAFCTVTALKCECTPNRVVCLHHTDLIICQCKKPEKSTWILRMKYTDNDLHRFADIVSREAYKPNQWKTRFQQLMLNERKPSLESLRNILTEGQRIPNIQEDLKALRDYIEAAQEWIDRANNILFRKKKIVPEKGTNNSKRMNERKASQYRIINNDDEGYSVTGTSSSRSNSKHNIHAKDEHVESRSLVKIRKLLDELDSLGFETPEASAVKEIEAAAIAFQEKARALLASDEDKPLKVYKDMIAEAKIMDVEVEELVGLVNKTRQADWAVNAQILIKTPNALFDLERVINIMEEGKDCNVKADHPFMLHFKKERDAGTQWRQEASTLLKSKTMEYDQVHDLVTRGEACPVVPELLQHLKYELQRADEFNEWMEKYGGVGPQPANEEEAAANAIRANIGDINKLLKEYEDFPIRLDALPNLRQEVQSTDEWVAKTRKNMLSARVNNNTTPTQPLPALQEYLDEIQNNIKACCNNVGTHDENGTPIFCICRLPENGIMVECDICKEWYHIGCVKVPKKVAETSSEYTCPVCDVTAPFPFGKRPTLESFQIASEEAAAFKYFPEEKDSLDIIVAMVTNWKTVMQDFISRPMVAGPSDRFRAKQHLRAAEGMPVAVDEEAHELRKKVVETSLHENNMDTHGASDEESANPDATYCVCKSKYDEERPMVQCDGCHDWYHLDCIGLSTAQADQMERYLCPVCNPHQHGAIKQQKRREAEPAPKKIKLKINVPAATAAVAANDKKQKRKMVIADDPKDLYKTSSSDRRKRTETRNAETPEPPALKRKIEDMNESDSNYDCNIYDQPGQQHQGEADPQQVVAAVLLYYAQMGDQAQQQQGHTQRGVTNGVSGSSPQPAGDSYQQQYPDWQYYQEQSS